MAEQNEYYDFLFAYSLGCLDENDLNILKEYLQSGREFAWQELGEFQNLASLLPSILNIESPSPQLKDKVARNLYRIRDEKRLKLSAENFDAGKSQKEIQSNIQPVNDEPKASNLFKTKTSYSIGDEEEKRIEEEEKFSSLNKSGQPEIETFTHKLNTRTDSFEVVSPQKQTAEYFRPPQETQIHGRDVNRIIHNNAGEHEERESEEFQQHEDTVKKNADEQIIETPGVTTTTQEKKKTYALHGDYGTGDKNKKEKKKSSGVIIAILLFIIVAAGIIFTYYKISSDVKSYKTNIEKLDQKIQNLSSSISANKELENLLQSKNVRVINLQGTPINPAGYGKLIIGFDNSKGFFQFSNMPLLSSDKSYQLWISMQGKFSSLGVFQNGEGSNYSSFALPEITNQAGTKFIVSEEPSNGSIRPGKRIFLTGSLQ
ncbi:MAG: anti-sigma factor [Ignavibacteriaceae bacterium]